MTAGDVVPGVVGGWSEMYVQSQLYPPGSLHSGAHRKLAMSTLIHMQFEQLNEAGKTIKLTLALHFARP